MGCRGMTTRSMDFSSITMSLSGRAIWFSISTLLSSGSAVLAARLSLRSQQRPLTFHHVTDLKVNIDWGDSGHQVAVAEMTLDCIERQLVEKQLICLDRPYYRWSLQLNSPRPGGAISFGASSFTQILRQEPVLCDEQKLEPAIRARLCREF